MLGVGIKDGDIGGGAEGEATNGQPKHFPGADGKKRDKLGQRKYAPVIKLSETERHGGLKTDNAEGRFIPAGGLLLGAMRRVVAGNGAERAITQALDKRLTVGFFPQRRGHFGIYAESPACLVSKEEMMGANLAGDRQTLLLSQAEHRD